MPGDAQARVDIAGVVAVDVAEGAAQAVFVRRGGDDVNVVGHQTVRPYFHPRLARGLGKEIEVELVVAVFEECALAAVSALSHVVGQAGEDHAREAGHLAWESWEGKEVNLGVIARVTVTLTPHRNSNYATSL